MRKNTDRFDRSNCYNCGKTVYGESEANAGGHVFCCRNCRTAWERDEAAKAEAERARREWEQWEEEMAAELQREQEAKIEKDTRRRLRRERNRKRFFAAVAFVRTAASACWRTIRKAPSAATDAN